MYSLNVKVEDNEVKLDNGIIPITENTLNTIKLKVTLPSSYESDLNSVVVFTLDDKNYKKNVIDGEVVVPYDVLVANKYVTLGIYTYKENELIYSPKPTHFIVNVGSYKDTSEEEQTFTQDDFDLWLEQANNKYAQIEALRASSVEEINTTTTQAKTEIEALEKEQDVIDKITINVTNKLKFSYENGYLYVESEE